jgi:D-amino-acid oxidase
VPTNRPDVLVVGAGVSGLSTAVRLAECGLLVCVRSDGDPQESTSAAAGAIWDPIYANHPSVPVWSTRTYDAFLRLESEGRPGVRLVDGVEASRKPIDSPEWARTLPGYRPCAEADLPPGFTAGWHYRAPLIDMPPYLDWLRHRLHEAGAQFRRSRLQSLSDGFADAPIVVNCSGVGARELVPDPEVEPIRGQLVAVRNPGVTEFFAEHTDELAEMTYLLPQGDVLLLGGSAEKGVDDPNPDAAVARGIVQRCSAVVPAVADCEVLGHRAGLRPGRPQIRLEHERYEGGDVVHNYGHSGAGVSLSWGCADDVAEMVLALQH